MPKIIGIILGTILIVGLYFYLFQNQQTFEVDSKKVRIEKVKEGVFEDILLIKAQIFSDNSNFINALENGSILKKYIKNGAMVQKGDLICELNNPTVQLNYMQQENGIIENINQLRNLILSHKTNQLNFEKENLTAQHDYTLANQEHQLNRELLDKEILPQTIFNTSKEKLDFQMQRKNLIHQSSIREAQASNQQINQIQQTIHQLEKSLAILKQNKQNFIIRATQSGMISNFDFQIGQYVQAGQILAQISNPDEYKIKIELEEYLLEKVKIGMKGFIEINNENLPIELYQIFPEVKKGVATCYAKFIQNPSKNLSLGQSFTIKILLSPNKKSILIPKGDFSKTTLGNWIYVLNKDRNIQKRSIQIGNENHLYYEVISGLQVGESVITSDYESFKKYKNLKLKP
ncbi:MAG: HlyD family efflux transporter periplasmic adaptor subunit [Flavobacteriales bacterium]|nr:HlyD family efflux transporter periplasmic adaptor subunit [Flavobacteriales bacterium]